MAAPTLSIVLPCYNEAENIELLFTRLQAVLDKLNIPYEIVAVDDGSRDNTYAKLLEQRERNPNIKALRLARNFGKENASSCGLEHAQGQAVVLMDSDLQHPPETIPEFIEKWKAGAKMVYGIRRDRVTDTPTHRLGSRIYYWLFGKIGDVKIPTGAGDFRLLDRRVVDAVNELPERSRFMKGLMSWVGFSTAEVPYDVAPRYMGKSSWSPLGLMHFALDGLLSFSDVPLRIWTVVGMFVSASALVYLVWLILKTLILGVDTPGFATIMVTMLMLSGIQMIGLGVMAEYIARIFTEVKQRPLYFIAEQQGFEDARKN
jgi:glycosyltransferase involved in cell wall biosynthesis